MTGYVSAEVLVPAEFLRCREGLGPRTTGYNSDRRTRHTMSEEEHLHYGDIKCMKEIKWYDSLSKALNAMAPSRNELMFLVIGFRKPRPYRMFMKTEELIDWALQVWPVLASRFPFFPETTPHIHHGSLPPCPLPQKPACRTHEIKHERKSYLQVSSCYSNTRRYHQVHMFFGCW